MALIWEYTTRNYQFWGPDVDEWPHRSRYAELLAAQEAERDEAEKARGSNYLVSLSKISDGQQAEGPEGERLIDEYLTWREVVELDYLNEFGAAGFELITVTREVQREVHVGEYLHRFAFPRIRVFCYFKRPKFENAPEPPKRTIGFRPADAPSLRKRPGVT